MISLIISVSEDFSEGVVLLPQLKDKLKKEKLESK